MSEPRGLPKTTSRALTLVALLLVALAVARIAGTYRVFSHTVDEPAHVATGMQWLDHGRYDLEWQHPPLARVAAALGPFLAGRRAGTGDMWAQGQQILYGSGEYQRTLTLARLGSLPFFLLACAIVWVWARRVYGPGPALAALALFTTLPPVLGHAGLATTDMAVTATLAGALFALSLWLDAPTRGRAVRLGVALAAAVLSKFTTLLFLPAAALVLVLWRRVCKPPAVEGARRGRDLALGASVAALLVWGGYRFSLGTLAGEAERLGHTREAIDSNFTGMGPLQGPLHAAAYRIPLPAPELALGLNHVRKHSARGHHSYLLGRYRTTGWWYFYPVALAVKTPLAFLALTAVGVVLLAREGVRGSDWRRLAPAMAAAAILLVCLPSRINIGVRHVLPLYPLLAMVAGFGLHALWARRPLAPRLAASGLLGWQLVSSCSAQPDNLTYFNEVARGTADRILLDSDLDWGQDLLRLETLLRQRRVGFVSIGYLGNHDLDRHDLPSFRRLLPAPPGQRATGWIAVSEWVLKGVPFTEHGARFGWLDHYPLVARAGPSIRLYYVPEAVPAREDAARP
jgi:hypothetical protein